LQVAKSLERAGLENFSRPSLNDRLEKATADYDSFFATFKTVRRHVKELSADVKSRKEGWLDQVKRYSKLVARNFDMYMQKKGFSGTGERRELLRCLSVQPLVLVCHVGNAVVNAVYVLSAV
jgi:hypothetical protein